MIWVKHRNMRTKQNYLSKTMVYSPYVPVFINDIGDTYLNKRYLHTQVQNVHDRQYTTSRMTASTRGS
jgi:hypothetical protein